MKGFTPPLKDFAHHLLTQS